MPNTASTSPSLATLEVTFPALCYKDQEITSEPQASHEIRRVNLPLMIAMKLVKQA